ncbi:hypothetical protein GEMRC1_007926 [Eukaryota sp. GEM-RC1]
MRKAASQCVAKANSLPSGTDYKLARVDPNFRQATTETSDEILSLSNSIVSKFSPRSSTLFTEQSINSYHDISDLFATLNEEITTAIEALKAPHRQQRHGEFTSFSAPDPSSTPQQPAHSADVNNASKVFVPKVKFHLTPLPDGSYPHPFASPLLVLNPTQHWFSFTDSPNISPLHESPLHWIDTETDLKALVAILNKKAVDGGSIAVSLAQHSLRSFYGFVCLMSITMDNEDYLLDTVALRTYMHLLLEPFTNPNLLKVMFYCENSLPHLQKDFGLYMVNLMDLHQAVNILNFKENSLSKLVKKHFSVELPKSQSKMIDWRIRPLSPSSISLARSESHFLLGLKNICLLSLHQNDPENSFIQVLFERSRDISLIRWENSIFDPEHWREDPLFADLPPSLHPLVSVLFEWRDSTARSEDESLTYVCPRQHLYQIITKQPMIPDELCNLLRPCPPIVSRESSYVCSLIVKHLGVDLTDEPVKSRVSVLQDSARPMTSPIPSQNYLFDAFWGESESVRQLNSENISTFQVLERQVPKPCFHSSTNLPLLSQSKTSSHLIDQEDPTVAKVKNQIKLQSLSEGDLLSDEEDQEFVDDLESIDDEVDVAEICKESSKNKIPKSRESDHEFDRSSVISDSSEVFRDPMAFMKRLNWINEEDESQQPKTKPKPRNDGHKRRGNFSSRLQDRGQDFFQGHPRRGGGSGGGFRGRGGRGRGRGHVRF